MNLFNHRLDQRIRADLEELQARTPLEQTPHEPGPPAFCNAVFQLRATGQEPEFNEETSQDAETPSFVHHSTGFRVWLGLKPRHLTRTRITEEQWREIHAECIHSIYLADIS